MIHGVREPWPGAPTGEAPGRGPAAAGTPHAAQNFADGDMGAPQEPQALVVKAAPHCLQKRPEAGVPHEGHAIVVAGVDVMGRI
jgi:hypothetical protein